MFLTGLIGWPLGHSRSPGMHNAAYAAAGIDGVYVPMQVRPERIAEAIRGLVALGFRGWNITIPHKQAVIPFIKQLSTSASVIGAVNTIIVGEDGSLFGDNTDAPGFMADLVEHDITVGELQEGGALVLGAGGSARAIAYALTESGIPTRILARRLPQAEALAAELADHFGPATSIQAYPWPHLPQLASESLLIVNCTPVGMYPHSDASPWPEQLPFRPHQILYDLVYNPPTTRLMLQAEAAGARAINGVGMLLYQGALSWQMWTAQPAPVEAMRSALVASLRDDENRR